MRFGKGWRPASAGAAGLALLLLACGGDAVAPDLIGTWTTAVPPHDGHYLRIGPEIVELGALNGDYRMYPIVGFSPEVRGDGRTFYTIEYESDEGAEISLAVEFVPGDPGTLRIGHRSAVWSRSDEAHASSGGTT